MASAEKPTLHLVGVPIGNAQDISLRALRVLRETPLLFCEDRKTAARLFRELELPFPRDNWQPLNEHTRPEELDEFVQLIHQKGSAALISDAGMPVFCDPGAGLVDLASGWGIEVVVVPGPTALTTALVMAGVTGAFQFLGFPPRERRDRAAFLKAKIAQSGTLVFYEAPYRGRKLLREIAELAPGERECYVAVNLTGPGEFSRRMTVREIPRLVENVPKGPIVVILMKSDERRGRKKS